MARSLAYPCASLGRSCFSASRTRQVPRRAHWCIGQNGLPDAAKGPQLTAASGKLCQLCEEYSTEALLYLKQNETQTEILSILRHECESLAPLKQQVSMVNPEKFCESVHLYKKGVKISLPTREGTRGLCHHVLVEVLVMLKDPNMQMASNGTNNSLKLWQEESFFGAREDGEA